MIWVLDHLADLESDFSRFHRVEDIYSLPGPRFFQFALRIFAYEGVMAARLAEQEQHDTPSPAPTQAAGGPERVELVAMQVMHPGLIERTVTHGVQDR